MLFIIQPFASQYQSQVNDLIERIQVEEFHIPIEEAQRKELQSISQSFQKGKGNYWVALLDQKVIGTIAVIDIGHNAFELRDVFLDKEYRGQKTGFAKKLLDTVLIWSTQHDVKTIYLGTTLAFRAAHRFYEKHGFHEIAKNEMPSYCQPMDCDEKFYRLDLEKITTAPSIWELEPPEVRKFINDKILSISAVVPKVHRVDDVKIERNQRITPLRIYTPSDSLDLPIVLFIHGGGWAAGNLDTHDNLARYLCKEAESLVVSVGYLNSPEGKFPTPLEQCYDALCWIIEHAKEFHADANRLAVVGDSAGGNMTAALCLLARDRNGPKIDLQVLINPSTDLASLGSLERRNDTLDRFRWYARQYVEDPNDINSPYVSPLLAEDLTNLPPALILLAEKDELRSEGQRYADRLTTAGIPTTIYTQFGVGHLASDGARASVKAQESLNVAVEALKNTFSMN
ncbi:MAG: GNAT family N-acetyltransferase [Parachlamydiaceae bacterium]|nr:GNAT family N-acetyltransferase [Parachlamydiaceae bacterium]